MRFNKNVFMAVLVVAYAAAFMLTFGALLDSVEISSIALVGLFGWFYGIRIGLLSVVGFVLLNTAILCLDSGKACDILLTYNPLGIILGVVSVWIAGTLREAQERLNETRASLAGRVAEATAELDELANRLIGRDEQERIQVGQDLHDGVGQYLTGMLLHSEALTLDLRKGGRVEADLAEWMTRRIQKNIQIVRQLSRSLLPIEFTEMSLETALGEMVSCFGHVSTAKIELTCSGDSTVVPAPMAQHLYRIAYEATDRAIHKHRTTILEIRLSTGGGLCRLEIEGGRTAARSGAAPEPLSKVMRYRIKAIGGNWIFARLPEGGFRMECSARLAEEAGS